MAEIVLSPILQALFDRLTSYGFRLLKGYVGFEQKIARLRQSLQMTQAFLEDAEGKQKMSKAVEIWLLKVKDMAYDADDLLDKLEANFFPYPMKQRRRSDESPSYNALSGPLADAARELKDMLVVLDQIIEEGFRLNLKQKVFDGHAETLIGRRESFSLVTESGVYGRREDKEKIIALLHTTSNRENSGDIPIVSIVGIGGIGKTTLAQLVYGDAEIIQFFDMKMWVYVSKDFDIKKVIVAIIESATVRKCEFTDLDTLSNQLRKSLCGKRYLLVLDDLWNEDQYEWRIFQTLLGGSVKGSKIIVTTRSDKVVSIVGGSSYHLRGLAEEDCWSLFKKRAFAYGEEEQHPNLLPIGEQIVKKCAGMPLAALTLGGSLRFRREESDWLFVKENEPGLSYSQFTQVIPSPTTSSPFARSDQCTQATPEEIKEPQFEF